MPNETWNRLLQFSGWNPQEKDVENQNGILSMKEIVNGVNVDNEEKNYEATQSVRKMLYRDDDRESIRDDVIKVRRFF